MTKFAEKNCRVLHECEVDGYLIRSMSSLYEGSRGCMKLWRVLHECEVMGIGKRNCFSTK